jgi:hypothetical protein
MQRMARLDKPLDELIELVVQNRERRIAQRQKQHEDALRAYESDDAADPDSPPSDPASVTIAVFGCQTPFSDSLMAMLRRYAPALFFDNAEEAISFIADYKIETILLDIDPPSDWEAAADVFAAVSILRPEARQYICAKNIQALHARMLLMRGARELQKPLFFKDIERLLHDRGD